MSERLYSYSSNQNMHHCNARADSGVERSVNCHQSTVDKKTVATVHTFFCQASLEYVCSPAFTVFW